LFSNAMIARSAAQKSGGARQAGRDHAPGQAQRFRWDGPTITFVIPWYGPQVPGGAELQCRRTAEEIVARGVPVEVFTTTAGGLMSDWARPTFPVGVDLVNGVRVQRFPVRARDAQTFDRLNRRLLAGERLTLIEEAVFVREIIGSDELEAMIAADRRRLFVFIPYMFGTTYWGARAARRAYVIPCVHDECYAYMRLYQQAIATSHALIFNSPAELRLAQRLFTLDHCRSLMLGEGVDMDFVGSAERFRERYRINEPFVLYVGRRDDTKNTPLLLDAFARYRAAGGTLRLVCVGGPGEPLPESLTRGGAAVALGFVPVQDKYDAYAAATALCQPSLKESFSLVVMESWVCGTPVLVHSDCAVTRDFCERSGGGLHFRSHDEFAGSLEWLHAHPQMARRMGRAGAAYVRAHFNWDAIITRLLAFLRDEGENECR
jgi:glycosyltransferase involved in cell wall biosynthesis